MLSIPGGVAPSWATRSCDVVVAVVVAIVVVAIVVLTAALQCPG